MTKIKAKRHQNIDAILFICLGFFSFSLGDGILKSIANTYPQVQIMCMVGMCGLFWLAIVGLYRGGVKGFWTKHPRINLFRGVAATVIAILNLTAWQTITLDVFYTVVFTAPFWVVILGHVLRGDEIGPHRLGALLFGFVVLLFMVRPGGALFSFGAFLVLLGTFLFAMNMIAVRFMDKDENPLWFSLSGPLWSVIILSPALVVFQDDLVMPSSLDMLICIGASLSFVTGAYFTGTAFHRATSSSVVAPFQYTQMIWGIILGYVLFGDVPTVEILIGSTLIALSGVYLLNHERRKVKETLRETFDMD